MFGDRFDGIYCIVDENGTKRYNLPVDLYDTSCSPHFKKKFAVYADKFLLPKRAVKRSESMETYEEEWNFMLFQWCYDTASPFNNGFYCFVLLDAVVGTGTRTDALTPMSRQLKYAALEEHNELFEEQCEAIHSLLVTDERAEMTYCVLRNLIYLLRKDKGNFKQEQTERWIWVIDFLRQKLRELDSCGFTINMRLERALEVGWASKKWKLASTFLKKRLNQDLIVKIKYWVGYVEVQQGIADDRASLDLAYAEMLCK